MKLNAVVDTLFNWWYTAVQQSLTHSLYGGCRLLIFLSV